MRNVNFKDTRWLEEPGQYYMITQHRSGSKQAKADGLSYNLDDLEFADYYEAGTTLESISCIVAVLPVLCSIINKQSLEDDINSVLPLCLS